MTKYIVKVKQNKIDYAVIPKATTRKDLTTLKCNKCWKGAKIIQATSKTQMLQKATGKKLRLKRKP
jgi:hypothetical protein